MPPVVSGVIFHWLGGLASGSFYVPFKGVKKWSWEVYWIVGGIFSWLIAPWLFGSILTKDLFAVVAEGLKTNASSAGWAYLFGVLWGIGGLTFGLTMRYLGMSLGMAVALGICTVIGMIGPDLFVNRNYFEQLSSLPSYAVVQLGLGVCLLGVIIAGIAGTSKEHEMPEEERKKSIAEFNLTKGLLVAMVSGVFSACMNFGLKAAEPFAQISISHGTPTIWVGLVKLCIVLLGGLTTNAIWCWYLIKKNKSGKQFNSLKLAEGETLEKSKISKTIGWNYFFSALAGTTWYFQFFFYQMGERKMIEAQCDYSSWTLHMASIIIFSSIWGLALHEWRGTSKFTKFILGVAIFTLIYSTIVAGYGNYLGYLATLPADAAQ